MKKPLLASFLFLVLWCFAAPVCGEETAIEKQKRALIGEWSCEWPGASGDSSTLIIHEIDAAKGKARCTYIVQPGDSVKSEHEILADFFSGANPKLSFRMIRKDHTGDIECILYDDLLAISFVGSVRGVAMSNTATMYRQSKK